MKRTLASILLCAVQAFGQSSDKCSGCNARIGWLYTAATNNTPLQPNGFYIESSDPIKASEVIVPFDSLPLPGQSVFVIGYMRDATHMKLKYIYLMPDCEPPKHLGWNQVKFTCS